MSTETYSINRPDVIDEKFDAEYVVVNLRTGAYYSLNPTAAVAWHHLNASGSRDVVLAELERLYATDNAQLAADLDFLLQELVKEQLIIPRPPAAVPKIQPDTQHEVSSENVAYLPPRIEKFTDMQALLILDPIHQVDESGWPMTKPDAS